MPKEKPDPAELHASRVEIRVLIDSGHEFAHDLFRQRPPIPDVGAVADAPGDATITLEKLTERRSATTAEWMATFSLVVSLVGTTVSLIQFTDWLIQKMKAHHIASVEINGRRFGDEAAIKAFLKSLAEEAPPA
jgi:hypothetical protein